MFQLFKNVQVDWLHNRRIFILISTVLLLAGLVSAIVREAVPGGTGAFNLGVDFKGGTVITAEFKRRPSSEEIRDRLVQAGLRDVVIQPILDKPNQVYIKMPLGAAGDAGAQEDRTQVDASRAKVVEGLKTFGGDTFDEQNGIIGTDAVGATAGADLRNRAISVTLLALVGILMYIAFRFEWSYGAAAVIAVFHDVLVTLGFFSIFQWEISLTVIAALLTLVGFSVNDTIVVFDRIRENLRLHRRESLYTITNDALNQTLSRTVITSGLVFLSVLAMVLFGGEVLRGFSLALLVGIIVGTYSSVAVAAPIMVWWQQHLEPSRTQTPSTKTAAADARAVRNARARAATR